MGFGTILSAAIHGIKVELIHVEADVSNGLPIFHMVGYLSSEVKEAAERVRTAIKNSGLEYPVKRTVVNLSPAAIRKRGASFDLPIAISILVSIGYIAPEEVKSMLIIGELSLDGRVQKVPGILAIVMAAKEAGIRTFIVPQSNATEGALAGGVKVFGIGSLKDTCKFLKGELKLSKTPDPEIDLAGNETEYALDYGDVYGQETVKRATEIAVAGGHSMLLVGSPGSGKTMTAQRIPSISPPMSLEESMEITKIYSIKGLLDEASPLIRERPFRSVHHTATRTALVGGGMIPTPGEISLAHGGVLFMDELPEFQRAVLEVLRQPLEEHAVQITRSAGSYQFPANFMLICAMNPCPCGMYPDFEKCTCTPGQIHQYLGKISQPFLDRLDICVEAPKIKYNALKGAGSTESSKSIRERVCKAREIQQRRYQNAGSITNANISHKEIATYCQLETEEEQLMEQAFAMLNLTVRSYHKILRVARTIADLDQEERIGSKHLKEAIGYRTIDKKYWGR